MNWGGGTLDVLSYYRKLILGIIIFYGSLFFPSHLYAQVGINTTTPQETLHLSSSTGTLRVESLNAVNNLHNGGDVNGDGNLSNDTFPLYVDDKGDFTLQLDVLENTGSTDALDDTILSTNTVTLGTSNTNGFSDTQIKTYTIVLDRPTLLEVKYNISHHIYLDNLLTPISDGLARKVENYISVSPDPDPTDGISNRGYCPSARSYTSASANSVTGPFYNGHTTYIKFEPSPGVPTAYTITIMGSVSSNIRGGFTGTISQAA